MQLQVFGLPEGFFENSAVELIQAADKYPIISGPPVAGFEVLMAKPKQLDEVEGVYQRFSFAVGCALFVGDTTQAFDGGSGFNSVRECQHPCGIDKKPRAIRFQIDKRFPLFVGLGNKVPN